jgi:hypothetical protein
MCFHTIQCFERKPEKTKRNTKKADLYDARADKWGKSLKLRAEVFYLVPWRHAQDFPPKIRKLYKQFRYQAKKTFSSVEV